MNKFEPASLCAFFAVFLAAQGTPVTFTTTSVATQAPITIISTVAPAPVTSVITTTPTALPVTLITTTIPPTIIDGTATTVTLSSTAGGGGTVTIPGTGVCTTVTVTAPVLVTSTAVASPTTVTVSRSSAATASASSSIFASPSFTTASTASSSNSIFSSASFTSISTASPSSSISSSGPVKRWNSPVLSSSFLEAITYSTTLASPVITVSSSIAISQIPTTIVVVAPSSTSLPGDCTVTVTVPASKTTQPIPTGPQTALDQNQGSAAILSARVNAAVLIGSIVAGYLATLI